MIAAQSGTGASAVSRRSLGPTAWVAFEVLVERSETVAGERVAVASVRTIAAELGVAESTAARALAALRAAGLVTVAQTRDGAGQFGRTSYGIHTVEARHTLQRRTPQSLRVPYPTRARVGHLDTAASTPAS